MSTIEAPSSRVQVRRLKKRGAYDRATIDAILDEAMVCHVGIVDDGQPFVIPTLHVRVGDRLYIHGSKGSRMLRNLAAGGKGCVTVSLIDALVLARSAFHHSVNYRSVVVLGEGRDVTELDEKMAAFEALIERFAPGRWEHLRPMSTSERDATKVIAFELNEASAKVRDTGVKDEAGDIELPIWAGLVPLESSYGEPIDAHDLIDGIERPAHVDALINGD